MNFSVIIPTRNRAKLLRNCVDSVRFQLGKHDELIIIDDSSTDATGEYLDSLKSENNIFRLKIFHSKKRRWQGYSRNTGIKNSANPTLIFIDDDCTLESDFVKNLKGILSKNPSTDAILATFYDPYTDNVYNKIWLSNYISMVKQSKTVKVHGSMATEIPLLGNCYVLKKNVFSKIGLFDESIIYREDTDLILRLSKAGIRILAFEKLKIYHYSRNNFFSAIIQQFYNGIGDYSLARKWNDAYIHIIHNTYGHTYICMTPERIKESILGEKPRMLDGITIHIILFCKHLSFNIGKLCSEFLEWFENN